MNDRHKNRGGHNKIDLKDREFENLTVIRDTGKRKSRRPIWLCKCKCGQEVEILGKYLLNGDTKSCGCLVKGNAHNRTGYKSLGGTFWYTIKAGAEIRGIPFLITAEQAYNLYINQDKKCALTGVDILLVENYRDDYLLNTASLDRIDSNKGYTIDNIQWVHKIINIMKNKLSMEEFREWCQKVVIHTPRNNLCSITT